MEARLAKVEAFVDTFKAELDRLQNQMDRLQNQVDRLHDEITLLREHMDRRFEEQRQYVDRNLAEIRKELSTNTRWLVGLVLANMSMTAALFAKVSGLF